MDSVKKVTETFPELEEIESDELREGVIDVWATGLEESQFDALEDIPWAPHYEHVVGDESTIPHIRDVTRFSIELTDSLTERRDVDVDRDLVVAGALLHDASKLFEHTRTSHDTIRELLEHPHYGVHMVARAELPVELQHIVLAHTTNSAVEPKTMEAKIVQLADLLAAESIFYEATGDIRVLALADDE